MKKLIAVVLALVLAFSCTAIAFAEDYYREVTQDDGTKVYVCAKCNMPFKDVDGVINHLQTVHFTTSNTNVTVKEYVCPGCGKIYYDIYSYNECLQSHNYGVDKHYETYIGMTIPAIIDTLRGYFVGSQSQNLIFDVLYKILEYVYAFIDSYVAGRSTGGDVAGVNGAVAELDGILSGMDLTLPQFDDVCDLVNTLKQKIKDLYAGNIETTIEETEAEAPAETGSANMGIAIFAAISVAAAAAFVCTKKKAE
jgi:uncharacterized C2H2 Zn-finger protein